MTMDTAKQTRYFIAKVTNFSSLHTCMQSGSWACKDRVSPPHPTDILHQATQDGNVVIMFSVNNCHGWHGYADMVSSPKSTTAVVTEAQSVDVKMDVKSNVDREKEIGAENLHSVSTSNEVQTPAIKQSPATSKESENVVVEVSREKVKTSNNTTKEVAQSEVMEGDKTDTSKEGPGWHYFQVNWKLCYAKDFGEQCLSFKSTEDILVDDQPLNKCRNWQEIPTDIGKMLCEKMENFYKSLCFKREAKLQKQIDSQPPAFYKGVDGELSTEETWAQIIHQVERELGPVVLACPFGSQRYNLSTPESDTDMFIIYQAPTSHMLGFHPPKQTIKSSERESCDYTIHEVYRYSELLLSGDAQCIETLFLHASTVIQASQQWHDLKQRKELFLHRECLNKYLRDVQGAKGTKYLYKWCQDNQHVDILPNKLCKMLYVVVRGLQNAKNIANREDLQVYREDNSPEKNQLMKIRVGGIHVNHAWDIIKQLEAEITERVATVPEKGPEVETFLQQWLLKLRYHDFKHWEGSNDT